MTRGCHRADLFGSFFRGLHEGASLVTLVAANSLHQEAELKLLEMKVALELQVIGSDNLRLAVGLVLDDLGVEAAAAPGQLVSQLIESVDGVKQEAQAARQEVEAAR